VRRLAPGLALSIAVAAVATLLGLAVPLVGGPVFGIVIGASIAAARGGLAGRLTPGLGFAAKYVLQTSIVLLGATLDLGEVARSSSDSLPVMLGTLAICLAVAALIGPRLRLGKNLQILIGVGTAICGASAIAAVSGVIAASEAEIAYAISTIFLYNVAAVVIFPAVGHLLALSSGAFAVWAGTAINDTSSVVAAAYAFGPATASQAVVVKLTRTLLIVPIVVTLALAQTASNRPHAVRWNSVFPGFIALFIAAVGLNSIGAVPRSAHGAISAGALFLIVVALSAVGLLSDVRGMRAAGWRPLLFGALLWAAVALSSLAIAHLAG
jgi:uncharacterized integral membrane protein (TIGR00698 family)